MDLSITQSELPIILTIHYTFTGKDEIRLRTTVKNRFQSDYRGQIMRKPTRTPARKSDIDVLVSEISSLRDSLELKQDLTNLRLEVAQLRQEVARIKRQSQGARTRKEGLNPRGHDPSEN